MSPDFDFLVTKRGDRYVLVAKKYGVVVWAQELVSGIDELEARVKEVDKALREAGVDQTTDVTFRGRERRNGLPDLAPFLLKTLIVTIFIAGLFISITLAAFAALREPASQIISTAKHPAQTMIRWADKIEGVSSERVEEWKLAVRKIVTKLTPLIDEVVTARGRQQSQTPKDSEKIEIQKN